jgi:hypothetical protein
MNGELQPNETQTVTRRQCVATSRNGLRCNRYPIPFGSVCSQHGGKSDSVINAARLRMVFLLEPALERLHQIVMRGDDPSAVRACIALLDRVGLGPSSSTHADVDVRVNIETMSTDDILTRIELLKTGFAAVKARQVLIDVAPPSEDPDD